MRGLLLLVACWAIVGCGLCDEERCDDIAQQIRDEEARNSDPSDPGYVPPGTTPCGARDDGSADFAHYASACQQLRDCLDECGE